MKRQALIGAVLAVSCLLASLPALAQSAAGMELYVFTSGSLGGFPKGALQIGGQGNIDWAPVSFYVIQHPKGNVMFDTGNNDKTITDPDGWWGPLAKGFGLKMTQDRKSTRLNSSHRCISYAVFCLKKKKKYQ